MIKSVDYIFTHSFQIVNIESVYKKLRNKSSKGIDKIGVYAFEKNKFETFKAIQEKVLNGTYKFSPYLENLKLKGRNKYPRVISIPTLKDRLVLAILKEILHDVYADIVNKKLPNKYISDIKKYSAGKIKMFFFQTDIQQFYDKIDREILFNNINLKIKHPILFELIKRSLSNITIPNNIPKAKRKEFINEYGIPQGLAISNILAQIYLADFDKTLHERNFLYLRYVDDILILLDKPFADWRIDNIKLILSKKNLTIHEGEKTLKGELTTSINYLGYQINKDLISVSDKNIHNFIYSIASLFTHFKRGYAERSRRPAWLEEDDEAYKAVFIENLNERITGAHDGNKNYGWLFFFSEITDKNLLFKLDKIIANFFLKLEVFGNASPRTLKKLVRAFYELKYNSKSSYINDYNTHDSSAKKLSYLIFRGQLDPSVKYSIEQIDFYYYRFKNKQLRKLEKDAGYSYF